MEELPAKILKKNKEENDENKENIITKSEIPIQKENNRNKPSKPLTPYIIFLKTYKQSKKYK